MSRFNRGARRVMDAKGRFIRVSGEEFNRLKAIAEDDRNASFSQSPSLSPAGTIPQGWRPKRVFADDGSSEFGSPNVGAESEEGDHADAAVPMERGPKFNPTVARVQSKSRARSGRFNELEQLIAGGDMEYLEPELFMQQSNEYHSFPLLFSALRKTNKAIDDLCKGLVQNVEKLEGRLLSDEMDAFVCAFCGATGGSNYAGVMALLSVIGKFNSQDKEGTTGFRIARRLLKCWREYALTETDTVDLETWKMACAQDQITGRLGEEMSSTYGSPGFQRLHNPSQDLMYVVDFFLQGVCAYLGFQKVDNVTAQEAYDGFMINVALEKALGVPHSLRQAEGEEYEDWIEKVESRLEVLDDAVEISGDSQFSLNDSQVLANIKEGMSKAQWIRVSALLDDRDLLWKNHSLDEAKVLCGEASLKKAVRSANHKEFRTFGNGSGSLESGSGSRSFGDEKKKKKKEGEKKQEKKKEEEGAAAEGEKRRKKYPCRFFEAGRCEKGDQCPFLHVDKTIEIPTPKAKPGGVVNMMLAVEQECSPVVADDARWRLRQARKFRQPVDEALEEMAELEADRSMMLERDAPKEEKRRSIPLKTEGYAMLGDFVDEAAAEGIEGRAALLDSSEERDESIDLESSGSDHEVTKDEERALKKKFVKMMDVDAMGFVPEKIVVSESSLMKQGELMMSTNSDELQEGNNTQTVHVARGVVKHHSTVWRTARLVKQQKRHEAQESAKVELNFDSLDAFEAELQQIMNQTGEAKTEEGVALEVTQTECLAVGGSSLEGIIGYHLLEEGDEQLIVAFDTQAGPSVVDTSVDISSCKITKKDNLTILGAGGAVTDAGTERQTRMVLGYNSEEYPIPVRQIPLRAEGSGKGGADMLIGVKEQAAFVESVSVRRSEVKVRILNDDGSGFRQVIKTHSIDKLRERMEGRGLVVVSLGDGAGTGFVALNMMGFQVDEYHAVENDPLPRKVADASSNGKIRRDVLGHDVMEIKQCMLDRLKKVDILIMTPDCGPWSALLDDPPGFDSVGGALFLRCAELKDELLEMNKDMKFWLETNCVSYVKGDQWAEDQMIQQENVMSVNLKCVSALSIGLGVSRFRRFGSNSPMNYEYIGPGDPDDSLQLWWISETKPGPCLVATKDTKQRMWVKHEQTKERRVVLADEGDRLMGYDTGFSCGFKTVDITEDERLRLIGKMICFQHYMVMFGQIDVRRTETVCVMSGQGLAGQEPDPDKLREFVSGLIKEGRLAEWIKVQRGNYEPLEFELDVDPTARDYKTDRIFDVPEGMADAVLAKMKSKEERNQFERVHQTSAEDWEHPMFFSPKPGRIDRRTGANDCRVLCACVYLNAHNEQPRWMLEFSPTVAGFLGEFSEHDVEFANVDDWDAFEIVNCKEDSQRYLHFVFRLRKKVYKYRAKCMVQGCNTSALFYPLFKIGIFDRIIGRVWKIFWAIYQDDTIVKGRTGQCRVLLQLLLAIYKEFNIPVSPKCFDEKGEIPITSEVKGAGFMIGRGGYITCNDALNEALEVLLTKVIRSEKQLRSLINTLIQAHPGFKFSVKDITVFGTEMAHLQRALKSVTSGHGVQYKEIILPTCERLRTFLGGMPRVQCLASELIDDDHCLIYIGDVGNTGKGMNVYRVGISDARDVVVPDDLEDPNISQLVRCFHGVISSDKLEWMTWENEADNVVESLQKTGQMLVTATMGYPVNGKKKVGVYSDASAAVLGCSNLFVPDGKMEFLTAKARKVAHWRDDIAFTEMLPIWFAGVPGHDNSLSDFLSHVHDELVTRAERQKAEKGKTAAKVLMMEQVFSAPAVSVRDAAKVSLKTLQGNDAKETDKLVMPAGYKAAKMMLSDDEWAELCSKYKTSKSELRDVPLSTIYNVLVEGGDKVSKVEIKKVMGWKHRIVPVEVGDGDIALFVKAPVNSDDGAEWADPMDETDEALIKLVVLLPEGVMVRVTSVPLIEEEKNPESYRYRDMRMDMLVMAHEFQLHAKVGMMYLFISQKVWFPELLQKIKTHIKECGLCDAKLKAARLAGHGMVSVCTYRHVGADHVVVPDWLKKQLGIAGVLMITDKASGKIAVEVQDELTAEQSAALLFIGWVQHNGLMRTLTTDQGSPFTAEVFEAMRKFMGVKIHNLTSVGNSVALGDTELENKWIQKVISEAGSKGDINSVLAFKMYLAKAVTERNQIMVTAGSTVFERIHGFSALTVGDAMMDPVYMDLFEGQAKKKLENTIAPEMAEHAQEMLETYQANLNERNYKAAFDRDSRIQNRRSQNEEFEKGSKVTWLNQNNNPEKGEVTAVEVKGGVRMAAWVNTGGQIKKVQYNALKQLAARRPQFLMELDVRLDEGMLAFWLDDEDELVGARVMCSDDENNMLVHYYEGNKNLRKWLPLWQDGEESKRAEECPDGMEASVEEVPKSLAKRSGFLKESGFVTEDTLLMLQAWLQE